MKTATHPAINIAPTINPEVSKIWTTEDLLIVSAGASAATLAKPEKYPAATRSWTGRSSGTIDANARVVRLSLDS